VGQGQNEDRHRICSEDEERRRTAIASAGPGGSYGIRIGEACSRR
jgi:hypothetical protein